MKLLLLVAAIGFGIVAGRLEAHTLHRAEVLEWAANHPASNSRPDDSIIIPDGSTYSSRDLSYANSTGKDVYCTAIFDHGAIVAWRCQ